MGIEGIFSFYILNHKYSYMSMHIQLQQKERTVFLHATIQPNSIYYKYLAGNLNTLLYIVSYEVRSQFAVDHILK